MEETLASQKMGDVDLINIIEKLSSIFLKRISKIESSVSEKNK